MTSINSITTFKIGDHVVISDPISSFFNFAGIITKLNPANDDRMVIINVVNTGHITIRKAELTLVSPGLMEHKLKVSERTQEIREKFLGHHIPKDSVPELQSVPYSSKFRMENFAEKPPSHDKDGKTNWSIQQENQERAYRASGYIALPEVKVPDLVMPIPDPRELETHSATIILASGREVVIPDPSPEYWELVDTRKDFTYHSVRVYLYKNKYSSNGELVLHDGPGFRIGHDAGLCWLADMCRVVNLKEHLGPFETRFSCITELRKFKIKEKPVEELPILSVLW